MREFKVLDAIGSFLFGLSLFCLILGTATQSRIILAIGAAAITTLVLAAVVVLFVWKFIK